MESTERLRLLKDLCGLAGRLESGGPLFGPLLRTLQEILALVVDFAEAPDFDSWLLGCAVSRRPSATGASLPSCPSSVHVSLIALRMAALQGLSREERLALGMAGLLKSLGPAQVGQGRLLHPSGAAIGAEVLRLLDCRLERLDGSGPLGLKAEELDEPDRLMAVAYRYGELADGSMAPHRALAAVWSERGRLSPESCWTLLRALSCFPLGSLVRLRGGELALVISTNPDDPLRPVVAVALAPDGRPCPPAHIPLSAQPEQAVTAIAEDPAAPELRPGESAESWLERLAAARPVASGHEAPSVADAAPIGPEAAQEAASREALQRLNAALGATIWENLPLEETLRKEEQALRSTEEAQAPRREAEAALDRLEFEQKLWALEPELAALKERYRQEARRFAERRTALERLQAEKGWRTLEVSWRERLAGLEQRRQALERRKAEVLASDTEWRSRRERLKRAYEEKLESARRKRKRLAERLRAKTETLTAATEHASRVFEHLLAELTDALSHVARSSPSAPLIEAAASAIAAERRGDKGLRQLRLDWERELASLDGEIARVSQALAGVEAAAQSLLEEEVQEKSALKAKFGEARRVLRQETPLASLRPAIVALRGELSRVEAARREAFDSWERRRNEAASGMAALEPENQALCACWRERLAKLESLRETLERRNAEVSAAKTLSPSRRERLDRDCSQRLESARRTRKRLAERLQARVDGLAAAAKDAPLALERLQGELAERLARIQTNPFGPAVPKLEAARFAASGKSKELREMRAAWERELASLDPEIERAAQTLAGLELSARRLEEEEAQTRSLLAARARDGRRKLREEIPLAPLRRPIVTLRGELGKLEAERQRALRLGESQRADLASGKRALERFNGRLSRLRQGWARKRAALEEALLAKRRELAALRDQILKAAERKERSELEDQRLRQEGLGGLFARLRGLGRTRQERRRRLEALAAALREEVASDQRGLASSMELLGREGPRAQEELERLRAQIGEARGLLSAHREEAGPVRHSIEAALAELDVKLLEARLSLDTLQRESGALSSAQGAEIQGAQQLVSRLETLVAECAKVAGHEDVLWTQWGQSAAKGLTGVNEALRQELLSRAREMRAVNEGLAELGERLNAARGALEAKVALASLEAAARDFQAGRLNEARGRLRLVLALRPDPEAERLLGLVEGALSRQQAAGPQGEGGPGAS